MFYVGLVLGGVAIGFGITYLYFRRFKVAAKIAAQVSKVAPVVGAAVIQAASDIKKA